VDLRERGRYFADNQANWDDRAATHEASGYGIDHLVEDPAAISDVVRQDVTRLGSLAGLDVVHLQCHLGTDTVSLKRLGARRVVGLDFSDEAIRRARTVAARCGVDIEFVTANVYDARSAIAGDFDVVYTSVGVLYWLPDIASWARVVAGLMKPGGRFVIRDDHPFRATIGDDVSHGLRIEFPYFERPDPQTWDEPGTYLDIPADAPSITHTVYHGWTHGLGEIVTALIRAGLVIDALEEFDRMAWMPWPSIMQHNQDDTFSLTGPQVSIPLEFAICAHRPA
jgi:SAM-dependent methyltransferase